MSLPTIWEAVSEVNIADYAINVLGYTPKDPRANLQAGERAGSSIRLVSPNGDIWAGVTRDGRNVWNSFTGSESGNIISLMKRDLNLSGKELAEEIKNVLDRYSIPYYDSSEEYRNQNQQTRRIIPSDEQKAEWERKKKEKELELARIEKENRQIFLRTYRAIQFNEKVYAPEGITELRKIPLKYFQMMGNNPPKHLLNDPECKFLRGNCIYTEGKGKNGAEFNHLNFMLKDVYLNVIGIAKKDAKTGKDYEFGAVARGSQKGFTILGNPRSRNIVLTESPLDAISFNISKGVSFERSLHFSIMGGLSLDRVNDIENIIKKRIKEDKPTTLYLAFDNDGHGQKYMNVFEERLRGMLNKVDPEGKKFKMIDARCDKKYSDYNDAIRDIPKDGNKKKNKAVKKNTPPSP